MSKSDFHQPSLFDAPSEATEAHAPSEPRVFNVVLGESDDGQPMTMPLLADPLETCVRQLMLTNSNRGIQKARDSGAGFDGDLGLALGVEQAISAHFIQAMRAFAQAARVEVPSMCTPQDLFRLMGSEVRNGFALFVQRYASIEDDDELQRVVEARRKRLKDAFTGRVAVGSVVGG